jgi:hypothetical protein
VPKPLQRFTVLLAGAILSLVILNMLRAGWLPDIHTRVLANGCRLAVALLGFLG